MSTIDEKTDRDQLYEQLVQVAKKKTAEADMQLDSRGKRVEAGEEDFGEHVLIVEPSDAGAVPGAPSA